MFVNKTVVDWHMRYHSLVLSHFDSLYLFFFTQANIDGQQIDTLQSIGIGLTHWSPMTHICIGKLTIIGYNNGLLPCRRQAIIRTNAGILLIGPLGTNFREILIEIYTFFHENAFENVIRNMAPILSRP